MGGGDAELGGSAPVPVGGRGETGPGAGGSAPVLVGAVGGWVEGGGGERAGAGRGRGV